MRCLVLDFDGVISDSARESFAVSWRTYLELCPTSPLRRRERDEVYRAFLQAMPLGNRAEDYGTTLDALAAGHALGDQAAYDTFRRGRDAAWLESYHRRFYEVRAAMAEQDPAGWRALMRPYPPVLELLRRRAGQVLYAIATAKDRSSVDALLDDYGVADLFPPELVLDKEAGTSKASHLRRLHERLGLELGELTFVDDKVNHLDVVAPLGVRCALAAWGYNGQRERELARGRGYLVCTLDDMEQKLFD